MDGVQFLRKVFGNNFYAVNIVDNSSELGIYKYLYKKGVEQNIEKKELSQLVVDAMSVIISDLKEEIEQQDDYQDYLDSMDGY